MKNWHIIFGGGLLLLGLGALLKNEEIIVGGGLVTGVGCLMAFIDALDFTD